MPDDLAEVGDQPAVDLDAIRRMYDDTNDFLFWRVSPAVAAAVVPGLVDEVAYLRRQRDELHAEYTELLTQARAERDRLAAAVERVQALADRWSADDWFYGDHVAETLRDHIGDDPRFWEVCRPDQPAPCGDVHTAGQCFRRRPADPGPV